MPTATNVARLARGLSAHPVSRHMGTITCRKSGSQTENHAIQTPCREARLAAQRVVEHVDHLADAAIDEQESVAMQAILDLTRELRQRAENRRPWALLAVGLQRSIAHGFQGVVSIQPVSEAKSESQDLRDFWGENRSRSAERRVVVDGLDESSHGSMVG